MKASSGQSAVRVHPVKETSSIAISPPTLSPLIPEGWGGVGGLIPGGWEGSRSGATIEVLSVLH